MFIKIRKSNDGNEVILNTNHIVLVTYYPETNLSRINTVLQGYPVFVDGNFMEILERKEGNT